MSTARTAWWALESLTLWLRRALYLNVAIDLVWLADDIRLRSVF